MPTIETPRDESYTHSGSFSVTGSAEARSTVELYEGRTKKGSATAGDEGRFSIALSGVPEGRHTYTATATGAAGNRSAHSAARTVTVDWTPPPSPTITAPAHNSYDTDGAFTVQGTAEPLSTIRLYEGTAVIEVVQTGADGNWSIALSGVPEGRHTYTATATDAAGNASHLSPGRTIIVDTSKPTVIAVSPAPNAKGVSPTAKVTATFSEPMRPASINANTVTLTRRGTTTRVSASVRYDAATRRAILNPAATLHRSATYIVNVTTGARDIAGNALAAIRRWSFTVKR